MQKFTLTSYSSPLTKQTVRSWNQDNQEHSSHTGQPAQEAILFPEITALQVAFAHL
jgi:hypothetical protein